MMRRLVATAALASVTACDFSPEPTETPERRFSAESAQAVVPQSRNMRLVGRHDLQGRSAYQPIVHRYGERRILFVGHHAGEAINTLSGETEANGLSVLDVTDPTAPELLTHVPATGPEASGAQHVQVCDGSALPNGDPDKIYLIRTNGRVSYELFDATNPAGPELILTIAETGYSARPESNRGTRETHKMQWECETGIAYLNGTPPGGWSVTRILQAFDMARPEEPRHIRDFGLDGWQPGSGEPFPSPNVAGLHQPFVVGSRMYLGYESGRISCILRSRGSTCRAIGVCMLQSRSMTFRFPVTRTTARFAAEIC